MPKRIVLTLPAADRTRWQAAADLENIPLERFIRNAIEAAVYAANAKRCAALGHPLP